MPELAKYRVAMTGAGAQVPRDAKALWRLFLRGKAQATKRSYSEDLRCFARFCEAKTVAEAIDKLLSCSARKANAFADRYAAHLREMKLYRSGDDPKKARPTQVGYAPATVRRRLCALRSVVEFAQLCGIVTWSLKIREPRAQPLRDTSGCGPEGYAAILAAIEAAALLARKEKRPRDTEIALRDLVLVRLLHDSGLRRFEVADIEWPHGVRLGAKSEVLVRRAGKNEPAWWPISRRCAKAIRSYLRRRSLLPAGTLLVGTHPTHRGSALNVATINRRLTFWSRIAQTRVTPHGLRQTSTTSVMDLVEGNRRGAEQWSGYKHEASMDAARRDERRTLIERISDPPQAPTGAPAKNRRRRARGPR